MRLPGNHPTLIVEGPLEPASDPLLVNIERLHAELLAIPTTEGGRGVRRDESAPPFTRAAIGIVETPAPRSAALRTGSPRSSRWCPGSSIRDRGQGRHLLRRQPQSLGRPSPCERGSHLPGVKAGHTMRWRRLGATLDAHASQTAGGSKCPRVVDNQCQPRQHHRPVTSRQETLNSTTCWLAASQPSSGEVGA